MKKDIPNNEERSQAPRFSYKRADRHRKKTTMAKLNALFAQLGPKRLAVLASVLMLLVTAPVVVLAVAHSAKVTIEKVAITSNTQGGQSQNGGSVVRLSATPTPEPTPTPQAASVQSEDQEAQAESQEEETTPTPTPTPEPHPSNMVIRNGIEAPVVAEIQARLMELDYMEDDEPTQYFGSITESAVRLFQRQHNLDVDGKVGMETYTLLMSDEATKYTVTIGADGTDVEELQSRLRELGYMDELTGHFGETTEAAVKKFQELNGLTVDGKVGSKTREALYSADAKANYMKYGEQSDEVKEYQERLKELGYLTTTPDGNYGADTTAAVKRFQELNGLIADGFLGYNTIKTLKSSSAQANALKIGMEGDDVERVQTLLKKLNYTSAVTGYFGSITEEAVKAFQKRNDLSADGVVGKRTMEVLTSSSAKKASSSSSSSSSSGSSSGSSSSSSSSSSSGSGVEKLISVAESKLGCTYVFGAKGPSTFDCSGFVYYCLNQAGISQGYMTSSAWQSCTKYPKVSSMSDLKRGDIISFEGHVGIYLGGGEMIDASSSSGKVRITSNILSSSYWKSHFVCGFRVF